MGPDDTWELMRNVSQSSIVSILQGRCMKFMNFISAIYIGEGHCIFNKLTVV